MAINVADAVEVPLQLFGGENRELAPSDLPAGVSPDCQDVVFLPGSVQSRPGLHRILTAIAGNPAVVYQKTYIQPDGSPLTLLLTADGKLWKEDVFGSPGTLTQIGAVPAGAFGKSVTAFGREYLAISDAQHGVTVPLQFDGTNLDRVSQDGPGAGPMLSNYLPPAATVQGAGAGASVAVTAAAVSDPYDPAPPEGGGGGGGRPEIP